MIPGYAGCEKCPLKDCPPVYGSGLENALMIIGEAPGGNEVVQGLPFVGKSGKLLERTLDSFGVQRKDVYLTNACLCRPDKNETPPKEAVAACHDRLVEEIERVNPEKILALGATALSSVVNGGIKPIPITKNRGLGMMINGRYVMGSYHPAFVLRDIEYFRDLSSDVVKWLSHSAPLTQPDIDVRIPETAFEATIYLDYLKHASVVGCDIETTGFDFLRDRILSIGFGAIYTDDPTKGFSVIIPIAIANQMKDYISEYIQFFKGTMVFHNGKFDLQFIMHWDDDNYDLWPETFADTMLMQCAQDERGTEQGASGRGYRTLGLKEQSRTRFDIPDYHFDFKKFFKLEEEKRDYIALYKYQGLDTVATARLYFELYDELIDESPLLWDGLCKKIFFPGTRALARMEFNGFPIDIEYFKELSITLHKEVDDLVSMLETVAAFEGFPNFKPGYAIGVRKVWASMGFNPPPGAEREVIQLMLKENYPDYVKQFVAGILEFRQKSKLLSTYVDGALEKVGADGRLRSDFLLIGADTGRLASRDPNLQNIPVLIGPIIRRGYIAPEGWTLAEIDYSQLELRIAAFYSRDQEMIRIFQEKGDIHRKVASDMFDKSEESVTYLERYMAKYVDFGIIYGRSAPSLASGWEMEYIVEQGGTAWTVPQAERFLKKFLDGMPGLRDWMAQQHKDILKTRVTETPLGRRRRFPYIDRMTAGHAQRQSVNTPVQSLASDICLWNLTTLSEVLPRDEAQVVSIVHDAIYVLIRNDKLATWLPYCIQTMETNMPTPIDVPIEVEAKIGIRWGELEKVKDLAPV